MSNSLAWQMATDCRQLPSANCAGVVAVACWKTICSSSVFFNKHADELTVGQARGMYALMELADNDLLDVLLGRTPSHDVLQHPQVQALLPMLKV